MEVSIKEKLLNEIKDADKILIGLGEEFDYKIPEDRTHEYEEKRSLLAFMNRNDLLPVLLHFYRGEENDTIKKAIDKLLDLIHEKDYYVVSTATNPIISDIEWENNRIVIPVGGMLYKQCINGGDELITKLNEEERTSLLDHINEPNQMKLGICPKCCGEFVLNNIFAEKYDENGYLPKWKEYTDWLQKTVNKKIVILELGVGMQFPSVIRWPFEKIAFYNNKASFWRVNEKLYHLTPELHEKGVSVAQNSIDWLDLLC